MDVFDIKVEKAKAILKYKRLEKITSLFRFMEVCIFLFLISTISTQFNYLSIKFSADFFRRLSITIFSPGFIFVIGNAIVLVLLLKYGQFTSQANKICNDINDTGNIEYVEICENRMIMNDTDTEEIKKQGKQRKQSMYEEIQAFPDLRIFEDANFGDKKMRKSQSEDFKRYQHEDIHRKVNRSMTESGRKTVNYGQKVSCYKEDEMSGDEFRRTVEAFIARQQKYLREEEDFSVF